MYFKRIKDLREDHDYTQNDISELLKCNRSTYANWENGSVLIPLKKIDKLTNIYKTSLAYILELDNNLHDDEILPLDYNYLLNKLNELRIENNYTYSEIANSIQVSISCCHKYHKNKQNIPVDKLISLSKLYNINIDLLCNKSSRENLQ